MPNWSSQLFIQGAKAAGRDQAVIDNSVAHAKRIAAANSKTEIVLTLSHLAHLTGIPLIYLRIIVDRHTNPYRSFLMRKRARPGQSAPSRRYRTICVPDQYLMMLQRWINQQILTHVSPHAASTAYQKGSSLFEAAQRHCGCKWLIKVDIQRFFESIPESMVYEVFSELGYPDLLSFELARLCTREPTEFSRRWKFRRTKPYPDGVHQSESIGFLPQGAPTSPRLANLVMRLFDEKVSAIASAAGLIYSRYADDLIFSTSSNAFSRVKAQQFVQRIYTELLEYGFEANRTKTEVVPPRARKIVLGLLVDTERPRLSKRFREELENHVYFIASPKHGPAAHAKRRNFASVIGLQNYVYGLLAHATLIDPGFGAKMRAKLQKASWPI